MKREMCEIDLALAEDLFGRTARMVGSDNIKGQITRVILVPGGRVYQLEWPHEGTTYCREFYGFQLELDD